MYLLYLLFRVLIYPFVRYFLPLFNDKAYKRMEFELKNIHETKPFKIADIGFEVSSQGELEQVKVLLTHLLDLNQKVELIFCSPSVEGECTSLKEKYPDNLAIYRMPIICFHPLLRHFNPKRWLTCNTFVMCRYDFFPSLISYGSKAQDFLLLAGTAKNFKTKNVLAKLYLSYAYKKFTKIITSHKKDKETFELDLGISENKIRVHDLRVEQILGRQVAARATVTKSLGDCFKFVEYLETLSASQKCIFGSMWAEEIPMLSSVESSETPKVFCIFPHKLGESDLCDFLQKMDECNFSYSLLDKTTTLKDITVLIEQSRRENHFFIFNFKGILCEFYSFFKYAYVGGGFGDSVHSLLEPFLAENYVFCGPKTQRSTEYTYIKEINPQRVTSLEKLDEIVFAIFELMNKNGLDESTSVSLNDQDFIGLLEWLEIVK